MSKSFAYFTEPDAVAAKRAAKTTADLVNKKPALYAKWGVLIAAVLEEFAVRLEMNPDPGYDVQGTEGLLYQLHSTFKNAPPAKVDLSRAIGTWKINVRRGYSTDPLVLVEASASNFPDDPEPDLYLVVSIFPNAHGAIRDNSKTEVSGIEGLISALRNAIWKH